MSVDGQDAILVKGLWLLEGVLKTTRKIIYQFIWGGRRGMSWKSMLLPKVEGGLGLWDPVLL